MIRHLETLFRHRLLLVAPLVLTVLVSAALVFTQSKTYEATANLYIDDAITPANARSDTLFHTPADIQSSNLRELVATRSFDLKVAQRGPLQADMQKHQGHGHTGLLQGAGRLIGLTGAVGTPQQQVEDQEFDLLSKDVAVDATGPQIVTVTFRYPDPVVAARTTRAVVDQFVEEMVAARRNNATQTLKFYQQQASDLQTQVQEADQRITGYLAQHPSQNTAGAVPDATLTSLKADDDLVRQRYTSLMEKIDAAQMDAAASSGDAPTGFRLMDDPETPRNPVSPIKFALTAVGGGIVAGLVLALLGLFALVALDDSIHRAQEVEGRLPGLRLGARIAKVKA